MLLSTYPTVRISRFRLLFIASPQLVMYCWNFSYYAFNLYVANLLIFPILINPLSYRIYHVFLILIIPAYSGRRFYGLIYKPP